MWRRGNQGKLVLTGILKKKTIAQIFLQYDEKGLLIVCRNCSKENEKKTVKMKEQIKLATRDRKINSLSTTYSEKCLTRLENIFFFANIRIKTYLYQYHNLVLLVSLKLTVQVTQYAEFSKF